LSCAEKLKCNYPSIEVVVFDKKHIEHHFRVFRVVCAREQEVAKGEVASGGQLDMRSKRGHSRIQDDYII
jgi:hypothetical protein